MSEFDYDVVVIGSGPAGQRAAIQAAKLGKKALLAERTMVIGGVCINTGTIPSKTLRETALNLSGWRERGFYGRSYRVKKEIGSRDLSVRLTKTLGYEVDVLEHQFLRNGVSRSLAAEGQSILIGNRLRRLHVAVVEPCGLYVAVRKCVAGLL